MDSSIPREELMEKIAEFTLMDDTYMTAFFDGQPELIGFVLRIILGRNDLTVKKIQVQTELRNMQGHSSVLDVFAVDDKNTQYDIEVQSRSDGAKPKRARFYSGLIDSHTLAPGEDYEMLPEKYVIFFTENDVFGKCLPIYTVSRRIDELDYAPFNDCEHIIYVNGSLINDTPLGKLVHDFKCKVPEEMFYKPLAERAYNLKETTGGNENMCRIMEELNDKAEKRRSLRIASKMLNEGDTIEKVVKCCELTLDEVKKLAEESKKLNS